MARRIFRRPAIAGALAVAALLSAPPIAAQRALKETQPAAPRTILARGELLAEAKARFARNDPTLLAARTALLKEARNALKAAPLSVMQKQEAAPSGNRHDYVSRAPYWWPDTTKPGGLPYIRRDGVVNPDSRRDSDSPRLKLTIERVKTLAYAWYFTGDARFARGAAERLRVFFLDTATRMMPHLEYAQSVPGVNTGRGTGIIDTERLPELLDAARLLDGAPGWGARDAEGFKAWCDAYLHWLMDSKHGQDERAAANNHGTFYDEQVAALALFVGYTGTARQTLGESARARIAAQIRFDGRQPAELARTRPLHYSLYNLTAFTMLAELARHVDVDLWHYTAPSGGSIEQALRFVLPYTDSLVPFPQSEVRAVSARSFVLPLRRAVAALDDPAFARALRRLPDDVRMKDDSRLAFPIEPALASDDDATLDAALRRTADQMRRTATALDPANGYPRLTRADGSWEQQPVSQWTSGFFAGTLWYLYQQTGSREWRTLAERWTVGNEVNKTRRNTHDLGFIIFNSFGHGYLLTGDPHYRDVVLEASASLATRFNPAVGATRSWDTEGRRDTRGTWKFAVIVDNLLNLEMLRWSAANGGDTAWAGMAERHALTSAQRHVRPDGSTAHVALFDPVSGAFERTTTWQGAADSSAWARGQAWAIHGLSAAYGRTRRPELLSAAQRAADWFIVNLPADDVPYWDFRDPAIPNAPRDASAAAIAASGLYDLARHSDTAHAARYRAAANRMLVSLATHYMAPPTPNGAVLLHSTGGKPQGVEIDVGIVYADYYFVEALLRRNGMFLE